MIKKRLLILGIRGIPASHGGFETFAERLAKFLVGKGWEVVVYCQKTSKPGVAEDAKPRRRFWQGIELVEIAVPKDNALNSIVFDFKATLHSLKEQNSLYLVLGYNTAIFSLLYFLKRKLVFTNMDGLEWHRSKWNWLEKAWLYLNEKSAVKFSEHLIADHPQIKKHYIDGGVTGDKVTVIPYCSHPVEDADAFQLEQFGLTPNGYAIVIARPEPENSILEVVRAFSRQPRGYKLVILGRYKPQENPYHREVLEAASSEVCFLGAIFDADIVQSLRYYSRLYIHGHTVGGTNPSLVEALAAGMPVLAHFNRFNYWVAGPDAQYFYDETNLLSLFTELLDDPAALQAMREASKRRFRAEFADDCDVKDHEKLFLRYVSASVPSRSLQTLEL